MQNFNSNRVRNCLVYDMEEMETILSEIFNDKVTVSLSEGEFNVSFDEYESDVWYDDVLDKLSEFFGVDIISVHVDQLSSPLVWLCFE